MSGSEGSACNKLLNKTKLKNLKDLWLDSGPATELAGTAYEEVLFEAQLMQVLHDYNASHAASLTSDGSNGDERLFIYYAPHLVHSPYQIPDAWLHRFDFIKESAAGDTSGGLRQVYTAMVSYMDTVVGNVTSTMRDMGLWANTLFLCSSDNVCWHFSPFPSPLFRPHPLSLLALPCICLLLIHQGGPVQGGQGANNW